MKNFNRLFVVLILAFGLMGLASRSQASVGVRAPKSVYVLSYTTSPSSVTAISTAQATAGLSFPGAVYELNMSTGAASDYVVLIDTTFATSFSATNTGAANLTNAALMLGPRYFFGSTTASTKITFDPPLMFKNGLIVIESSSSDQVGITYEEGRGLSGN